jgi:peptide/nickel transport system substrate-binding protein
MDAPHQQGTTRRRHVRFAAIASSLVALAIAGIAANGASAHQSGAAKRTVATDTTTLRILAAEPTSGLDPNDAVTQASIRVMELTYDTLLDYDKSGKLVPDLATSWKASPNGLGYTFTLRAGAKFSDGTPITAADVKFSLDRAAKGAALKSALSVMKSVTVVDSSTVSVALTQKSRVFLNALARVGNAAILSQAAVSASPTYFTKPTATSGPWMLTEYIAKDHITLTANPNYWKTGYPKLKTITYTFSSDPTSAAAALDSGTADMYFPMAPTDAQRLQKAGKINVFAPPSPGVLIWGVNKSKPPFSDVRVRQAFAYMVPRADRKSACWNNTGGVSYGAIILPGSWAYTPGLDKYKVSSKVALQRADALLTAAGWKSNGGGTRTAQGVKGIKDGTKLHVPVPFESNWEQARCNTQLLQNALKPAGIDISPQAYDPAAFYGDVAKNKFEMYHAGDGWATVDDMMQQGYTTTGQVNDLMATWSNKAFDKLVRQAEATNDLSLAKKYYHQAQQIILDQVPSINTGAQYSIIGVTVRLHGYFGRADLSNRSLITATLS